MTFSMSAACNSSNLATVAKAQQHIDFAKCI
jgi:hypothetical protein